MVPWPRTLKEAHDLDEFHHGHIVTYEHERLAEKVTYAVVWTEVCALGALLKHVGLVKGLAKELDINESCLEKLADEVRKDLGSE
jgi:hypothetical protein